MTIKNSHLAEGSGSSYQSNLYGAAAVDARSLQNPYCISALNEVENSVTPHAGWNNVWHELNGLILTLPGRGVITNDSCGEWRYYVRCSNMEDLRAKGELFKYSCHRPTCPEDYQSAARQKALSIRRTIEGKAEVLRKEGKDPGQEKHFVFSLPPDMVTPADLLQDKGKRLDKILDELMDAYFKDGFYAGAVIFHPFRLKRDGQDVPDDETDLTNTVPVWGPHFHFIGYGYISLKSKEFHKQTGWLYKLVKPEPGKERDIFSTAFYLLTHFGVFMKRELSPDPARFGELRTEYNQVKQSYRWVGEFRPHKIARKVLDHKLVPKKCEHCGEVIKKYPVDLMDGTPDLTDEGRAFMERLEKVVYYRVDRTAPDRGRSSGVIIDEISDYEHLVSMSECREMASMLSGSSRPSVTYPDDMVDWVL